MNKMSVKILVIDDDPFMHKLLESMLAKLGFGSVICLDNGHAGLGMIGSPAISPNLIVLDINMPEMDGIEFVRHLVERRFAGSLILISGEGERTLQAVEKLARAHQITVLGYLNKPASQDRLAELVERWDPPRLEERKVEKKIYSPDEVRGGIKRGEMLNYYQPKVEMATNRPVGVETLVRWSHPRDGILSPYLFVGVAEANGLIDDLTEVVLAGALAQAKIWREKGLKLQVAVNLSMNNFVSLDFPEKVGGMAAKAGVDPKTIDLELTESCLMEDLRFPLEILTRLRLKRFRLSIDDFGTGNSSMAQLRDLPFDELKIDQGFTHEAWKNEKLRAMYDTSLALGKQLGMSVVAEGVEDKADWDFVRKSACDIAQGYFIAKPMPAAELPGWVRSWSALSVH